MIQQGMEESHQQSAINPTFNDFHLSTDQFVYIQTLVPKGYVLIDARRKKDKKDPSLADVESQSQSIQQAVRNSSRRPQPKQSIAKRAQSKKISQDQVPSKPKQTPPLITLSNEQATFYQSVIGQIKKHPNVFPFLKPVDPIQLEIPDYFTVIKHPMDISTIQKKLKQKSYQTPTQFINDLNRIWSNSYSYNPKGSDMYAMTTEMDKFASKLLNKTQVPIKEKEIVVAPIKKAPPKQNLKPPKKAKQQVKQNTKMMTAIQKKQLKFDIQQLPVEYLGGIWQIIAKDRGHIQTTFDLNGLQFQKLKKLDAYCRDVIHFKRKQERKVIEPTIDYQDIVSVDQSSFIQDSD